MSKSTIHPTTPDPIDAIAEEFDAAELARLNDAELARMGVRAFSVLNDVDVEALHDSPLVTWPAFDLRKVV